MEGGACKGEACKEVKEKVVTLPPKCIRTQRAWQSQDPAYFHGKSQETNHSTRPPVLCFAFFLFVNSTRREELSTCIACIAL